MIRIIFLLLWVGMFQLGQAQRPIQLSERGALLFLNGFHPVITDEALYFNAFDQKHGWQLFSFDGHEVRQLSRFSKKITVKKVTESAAGGGVVSAMKPFQKAVIFHAISKTIKGAIYKAEGGRLRKLANGVTHCSEPVVLGNKVLIEAYFTNEEIPFKRTITIYSDWQVVRGAKIPVNDQVEGVRYVQAFDNQAYGVKGGRLMKWGETGFIPTVLPFTNVQNVFVLGDQLYFTGVKDGQTNLKLFAMNSGETVISRGDIFPGMNMLKEQLPLVVEKGAYFVADPGSKSLELYRLTADTLEKSATLTTESGFRSVQGMDWSNGQLFINVCGVSGTDFDQMQFDGETVVEHNPNYLKDVKNTTVFNERLIFLATEMGREALYVTEPILPPTVVNDTFRIFDFWRNGTVIGQVRAEDSRSRIRYNLTSGNDNQAFDLDYFSGELKIANYSSLKNRGGRPFILGVNVENRQKATANAEILIEVVQGKSMNLSNLRETMMFFPDFERKSTLTTRTLPEGQVVGVYDMDFNLIDELKVHDRAIVLGPYPPGIYLLNVQHKRNLYQKIELQ